MDNSMKQLSNSQPSALAHYTLLLMLIFLLAACGRNTRNDSGPTGPVDLSSVRNAVPKYEKQTRAGNPDTYVVFGKRYYVKRANGNFRSRGIASWYGRKFHGRKTSNGETYNMYAMTAAHKTLRIPAYVKVTNLENGRIIVVRVNDRGPFVNNRIIDLSYAAAHKLGITRKGTGLVKIAVVKPGQIGLPVSKPSGPKLANTNPSLPVRTGGTTHWQHQDTMSTMKIAERDIKAKERVRQTNTPRSGQLNSSLDRPNERVVTKIQPKVPSPVFKRAHEKPTQKFAGSHKVYLQVGAFFNQSNARRLLRRVQFLASNGTRIFRSYKNQRTLFRVRVGPIYNMNQVDQIASKLNGMGISNTRVIID